MEKIVLASTSPRRRELLKKITENFEIVSPDYDEKICDKEFSYNLVETTAKRKCESVISSIDYDAIVISADTVVVYDNKILGKPKDFDNALGMLEMLNGKTHKVVTSVCVANTKNNKITVQSETSEVTFKNHSKEELISYINDFKPFDKAGSYGIQELPDGFVTNVKGDYYNIVGFPVALVEKILSVVRT